MEPSDEQLVRRCKQQLPYNATAFEALLRRYEPVVFRTCLRYLGSEPDAEEACQDAFLRAFHALPNFEGRSAFRTWLFRIVANVCATRWAKLKKQREQTSKYLLAARQDEVPADYRPDPDDFPEISGIIGDSLDTLGEDDRLVLILRHISELSFEELAASLNISLSAAKMRLYRAEQRLRAAYESAQRNDSD